MTSGVSPPMSPVTLNSFSRRIAAIAVKSTVRQSSDIGTCLQCHPHNLVHHLVDSANFETFSIVLTMTDHFQFSKLFKPLIHHDVLQFNKMNPIDESNLFDIRGFFVRHVKKMMNKRVRWFAFSWNAKLVFAIE